MYYNNKKYSIDITKIIEYCLVSENKNISGSEITEGYEKLGEEDDTLTLTSRVIRENIDVSNPQNDMISYDIIKMFLSIILGQDDTNKIHDNFSFVIAFNTFVHMGFIVEV